MKFKTLGKQQKTPRGFRYIQFEDILGISTKETCGWIDYKFPQEVTQYFTFCYV